MSTVEVPKTTPAATTTHVVPDDKPDYTPRVTWESQVHGDDTRRVRVVRYYTPVGSSMVEDFTFEVGHKDALGMWSWIGLKPLKFLSEFEASLLPTLARALKSEETT